LDKADILQKIANVISHKYLLQHEKFVSETKFLAKNVAIAWKWPWCLLLQSHEICFRVHRP